MTPEIKARVALIRRGEVPEGYRREGRQIAPATWRTYRLGDIYTERKEPGEEQLPILTVSIRSGVSDGALDEDEIGKKVKRIEDKSQYKKAVSGDLVFNMMRAWQGAVGTVRTTGMVSPAYIVAEPNDSVCPLYMDYWMKTPLMVHTMHSQSYGVTDFRLRLYWDSFAPIKCTLPPAEEQQKIADILTAQNRVIELKEQLLAEKLRQKQYLMQQLLTGKMRLPGFTGEWKRYCFADIWKTLSSRGHQINSSDYQAAGAYPVIDQGKKKIVAYSNDVSKLFACPPAGVVVFGDHTREIKYIDFDFIVGADGTQLLSTNPELALTKYMYYALSQKTIPNNGYSRHFKYVKEFIYHLPSIEEQTAIANVLSAADREIDLLRQEIEAEQQKKKALMQLLLTGIVRV